MIDLMRKEPGVPLPMDAPDPSCGCSRMFGDLSLGLVLDEKLAAFSRAPVRRKVVSKFYIEGEW